MTSAAAAATVSLAVVGSVVAAFRSVLGRPVALAGSIVLPTLAAAGLIYLFVLVPWVQYGASLPLLASLALPMSYLGPARLHSSLFRRPVPAVFLALPPAAYAKVFAYYLLWFLWFFSMPSVVVYLVKVALPQLLALVINPREDVLTILALWLALLLPGLYAPTRLLLAAPAVVAGRPATPRSAWRLGAHNGLRLFAAMLLVHVAVIVAASACFMVYVAATQTLISLLGMPANMLTFYAWLPHSALVIALIALSVATSVLAELLAVAYRRITGWTGPQPDILERFE